MSTFSDISSWQIDHPSHALDWHDEPDWLKPAAHVASAADFGGQSAAPPASTVQENVSVPLSVHQPTPPLPWPQHHEPLLHSLDARAFVSVPPSEYPTSHATAPVVPQASDVQTLYSHFPSADAYAPPAQGGHSRTSSGDSQAAMLLRAFQRAATQPPRTPLRELRHFDSSSSRDHTLRHPRSMDELSQDSAGPSPPMWKEEETHEVETHDVNGYVYAQTPHMSPPHPSFAGSLTFSHSPSSSRPISVSCATPLSVQSTPSSALAGLHLYSPRSPMPHLPPNAGTPSVFFTDTSPPGPQQFEVPDNLSLFNRAFSPTRLFHLPKPALAVANPSPLVGDVIVPYQPKRKTLAIHPHAEVGRDNIGPQTPREIPSKRAHYVPSPPRAADTSVLSTRSLSAAASAGRSAVTDSSVGTLDPFAHHSSADGLRNALAFSTSPLAREYWATLQRSPPPNFRLSASRLQSAINSVPLTWRTISNLSSPQHRSSIPADNGHGLQLAARLAHQHQAAAIRRTASETSPHGSQMRLSHSNPCIVSAPQLPGKESTRSVSCQPQLVGHDQVKTEARPSLTPSPHNRSSPGHAPLSPAGPSHSPPSLVGKRADSTAKGQSVYCAECGRTFSRKFTYRRHLQQV